MTSSIRQPRQPRARAAACCALALAATVALGGCRRESSPSGAAAEGSTSRLSELLRKGARPGELTEAEREDAERLLVETLPKLSGPLDGYRWRVAYDDLPEADFVSIDLMKGEGEAAPRAVWFHLFWRGPLPAAERDAWLLRLGRYPARGVEGHHLFVRLGGLELRAVADAEDYRDPQKLRSVIERMDLDALARL
jgi:hypothetical protein